MRKTHQSLYRLAAAAIFAAAIAVVTAYLLHIPIPTGGYLHLGDTLIYLAACLLPLPYAAAAAAVGAGLADLLTAPMWVLPTLIIKALLVLPFTRKGERLLCRRNGIAAVAAGIFSTLAYSAAACLLTGSGAAFLPQLLGTMAQGIGSGVLFAVLALALDRMKIKSRLGGL